MSAERSVVAISKRPDRTASVYPIASPLRARNLDFIKKQTWTMCGGSGTYQPMKLGIQLPQISAGAPDQMGNGGGEEIARGAIRAEQTGYHSLWVSDHLLVPETGGTLPAIEIMDPIPTLAYAAALTRTIRLATSVLVVPYRNPIHLAKELATLDRLCNGRLVVGAASGWLEAEFHALGVSYEKRGLITDEAIRLWRELWSNPTPNFRGEFTNLSGMHFGPRPAAGKIPIIIGGLSKRACRRAVELGDGWHGSRMKPEEVATRIGWIKEIAARQGRSLDGFSFSHRVYMGFAERWTETGGYVQGIMAPPRELADYLNKYDALGIEEILVTPIGLDRGLEKFLDRFDAEVKRHVNIR
jgi:probable F420-dependent oxidoreductase